MPGRFLMVLLLAIPSIALPARAEAEPPTAVVLTYHVVHSPTDTVFSMTREQFRVQMEFLKSAGYTVIPLAELHDYVTGKIDSIPQNSVVITVDDGWKCTYTEIYPVLKDFEFPFTVFLYPKFIGMSPYALRWNEVEEMAADGVDIQSHTNSHSFLTRQSHETLLDELRESKEIIEAKTGQPVRFLAYPYGDYNTRVARATEEAGYDAGLTCDFGQVRKASNPYRMKRVIIHKSTTFSEFRKLLGSQELKLDATTPSAGGTFDPAAPVISARIEGFESLDPESVQLALVGRNGEPFSYDPRDGTISLVVRQPLAAGSHRAAVWAIDMETGQRREAVWSFRIPESSARVAGSGTSASRPARSTGIAGHRK